MGAHQLQYTFYNISLKQYAATYHLNKVWGSNILYCVWMNHRSDLFKVSFLSCIILVITYAKEVILAIYDLFNWVYFFYYVHLLGFE